MDASVNFQEENNIVTINVKGRINFSTVDKYFKTAQKIARSTNCHKYLLDHTETEFNNDYNLHTSGSELQQFGFNPNDKIAILITKNFNHSAEKNEVYNFVGWCDFKYFFSKSEAVDWLLQ